MEQEGYLGEFMIPDELPQPTATQLQPNSFVTNWTANQTRVLLDIYKEYRSRVGTFEIKNLKKLWEVIATRMNEMLKTNYSPSHVENRWRVVERAYKKFVDGQNKTGRGRKFFEFQEEMDSIFKGKRNVRPEVLLATDTVEHVVEEIEPQEPTPSCSRMAQSPGKSPLKRKNPLTSRNATIEQTRKDRKEYNRERLELEREKLEVQKEKVVLMKERNNLLRDRNELLKNKTCFTCSKEFM